jgi:hypothetical protein
MMSGNNSLKSAAKSASSTSWNSRAHEQELERLNRIVLDFEKSNFEHKEEIDRLKGVESLHLKRLQEYDKQQKQLLKRIKSMEVSLKYEKAAVEGLRKRGNSFEASFVTLKEESLTIQDKLQIYTLQNEEYQRTLQHERSTRLQLMHEKNQLALQFQEILKKHRSVDNQLSQSNSKIVDLIQQAETLTELSRRQEVFIHSQSEEFGKLSEELVRVKGHLLKMKEDLLNKCLENSGFHFSVDVLQKEISYLRKELISNSKSQTNRCYAAFHSKNKSQYAITDQVNRLTASRFEASKSDAGKFGCFLLSDGIPGSIRDSSASSPERVSSTQSVTRLSTANRPRGALDFLSATGKDSAGFNNLERVSMLESIRAGEWPYQFSLHSSALDLALPAQHAVLPKKSTDQLSLDKRSLFIGSGLNLKHNEDIDRKLKDLQSGSTKQILKKILNKV